MKDLGICADCGGRQFLVRANREDWLMVSGKGEVLDGGGTDGVDNEVRCADCDAFHTTIAQLGWEWENFVWKKIYGEE